VANIFFAAGKAIHGQYIREAVIHSRPSRLPGKKSEVDRV